MRFFLAILTIATTTVFVAKMQAAQIVLRSTAEVSGAIVRLGDVANVVSSNATEKHQLESVELFPVPSKGQKRYVRQREIQDLLTLAGTSIARHRFSGSSNVAVYSDRSSQKKTYAPVSSSSGRRAKQKVEKAILDYFEESAERGKSVPWMVEPLLDEETVRTVLQPGTRIFVSQAKTLKVGTNNFTLEIRSHNDGSKQIEVEAELSLPNMVVATIRRLPRGVVIRSSDVELVYDEPTSRPVEGFYSISDVVGKELVQSIGPGNVIPRDKVRSPIVVRKNEVVTVVSRAAGIAVSTNARAKEDGGIGDLVPVESLEDREMYFAKVTGLRKLEIFASSVEVQPEASGRYQPPKMITRKVSNRRGFSTSRPENRQNAREYDSLQASNARNFGRR